jgi:hypothetical protein
MLKKRHNTSHIIMIMVAAFICALVLLYVINYRIGMPRADFVILAGGIAVVLAYTAYSLTVGRDAEIVSVHSDYPPEIDPLLADCVVDGALSNRGITAAFYYMAQERYIEISEYERGMFQFTYKKFPYHESHAMRMLFRELFDNADASSGSYSMHTVRLSAAAPRLIRAVPRIRKRAFRELKSLKNHEIADMAGKVNGFIATLMESSREQIEEIAKNDPDYLYKIIPYAYTFSFASKIPSKMENVKVSMPEWYHAFGIDENEYEFDVLYYNAMLRNLPMQLKSEVFDKTHELPPVNKKP